MYVLYMNKGVGGRFIHKNGGTQSVVARLPIPILHRTFLMKAGGTSAAPMIERKELYASESVVGLQCDCTSFQGIRLHLNIIGLGSSSRFF